ncbi:hypothetical protein FRC07_001057 [Ceratobasidium sp. 392]|nr:hypothetical protein FRC07_001057 [Ceratobasidium sp. 392]
MSVPPPGAGEAQIDEVRRAWSCEPPVNVEVRVGRSFAGDWSQCMVIDVSDEEDEEDMVTDASPSEDESELEDESQEEMGRADWERRTSGHKDLAGSGAGKCLRDVVESPERDEVEREPGDTIDYFKGGRGASKYYIGGGGPSAGSGSGANAVEAVQSAIVRLAMDNAEISHAQRMQELQSKFLARPPLSAGLVPRYPTHPHLQPQLSLDYPQYSRTSQMQASINAYFDPPTIHVLRSKSQSQHTGYPKSNPALDSLRSGLEKRVAASASAIEEAVRARSASPSLPQAARVIAGRSVSGPVLPPRLQRLQAARAWTPPKLSLPQLEIPPFSRGPPSAQTSAGPLVPASPVPSPALPQQLTTFLTPSVSESPKDSVAKQPPPPLVAAGSASPPRPTNPVPSSGLSAEPKKTKPTHLPDIAIDQTPVPVAPATAPLTRSKRNKHHKRRSADGASSKNHAEPSTPAVGSSNTAPRKAATPVVESLKEPATPNPSQPSASASSPTTKPRPRGRHSNRYSKFKKGTQAGKQNALSIPSGSSSAPAPAPPSPPPPPPASAPIPVPAPTADTPSPPIAQENTTITKPFRKKKYYKKSRTNKPGSTSTGS